MKDKTKASEEISKAEEEPQKSEAYEFFEPIESARVNSKLNERVKKWRQNKLEKVPKSCQNGKSPAKSCNGLNKGVTSQHKAESVAKPAGESSKSEITMASGKSSEAKGEPQKPVAHEFFEPKESAIFNFKLKEKTKLCKDENPQEPVANEFFKPKTPAILMWLENQGLTNIDLTPEISKAEPVAYDSFEPKESSKVNSKLGAYEFVEPKESPEVDSKLKADLRAKFEINQINRGLNY